MGVNDNLSDLGKDIALKILLPEAVNFFKRRHAELNPAAPALTDAQAFAILHDAVVSTVAKDDALAADIRRRNPGA